MAKGRAIAQVCVAACAALLASCSVAVPSGRVTLSCAVSFSIRDGDVVQLEDESTRILWLDLDRGLYALSELGETRVDDEWAEGLRAERAQNGGLARLAGRSGAFFCFERNDEGLCIHGVDVDRRLYAFTTPVAMADATTAPDARASLGRMDGQGQCSKTAEVAWPEVGALSETAAP